MGESLIKETKQEIFAFEDWKEKYHVLLCLKDSEDKQTWLLEERKGRERFVLKKAAGEQGKFLQAEYELLKELTLQEKSINPKIIELKSTEEEVYLLRPYVQGATIRELVEQDGVMTVMEAAELLRQLCRKIAIFHHYHPPVIHRDIKPENIIVTAMGRIRLIDFETARCYKPEQPKDTVCIGTRGYAAPEQFGFGQTDVRTDIYGAGKVLLYMVTAGCEKEDIKLLKTGKEKELKKIILRCCAYDPDKRYQNIEQLEEALSRFLKFSGDAFKIRCIPWFLTGVMGLSIIWLGSKVYQLERSAGGGEQIRSIGETVSDQTEEDKTGGNSDWNIWSPYKYEENIKEILQKCQEKDEAGTALACEAMVERLLQDATIMQVETIDVDGMTQEEWAVHSIKRTGYEFIADKLASGDGRIVRQLGNYEQQSQRITKAIRECIECSYIDQNGEEMRSDLYQYAVEGNRENMAGCIFDILNCLNGELEVLDTR